jgi:hypothetical protein
VEKFSGQYRIRVNGEEYVYDNGRLTTAVIRTDGSEPSYKHLFEDLSDVSLVGENPSFNQIAQFLTGTTNGLVFSYMSKCINCSDPTPSEMSEWWSRNFPPHAHHKDSSSTLFHFIQALEGFSETGNLDALSEPVSIQERDEAQCLLPNKVPIREIFKKALNSGENGGIEQIIDAIEMNRESSKEQKTITRYLFQVLPIIALIDLEA